ncbi:unknown [Clostridium sp. CAG:590]|nr:unknown [Clostridium sp. CAG:590]
MEDGLGAFFVRHMFSREREHPLQCRLVIASW